MGSLDGLDSQVKAVLGEDERLVGSFVGNQGPRPGIESLVGLIFVVTLIVTASTWIAVLLAVPMFVAIVLWRTPVCVVMTNRAVLLVDLHRFGRARPAGAPSRFPLGVLEISAPLVGDEFVRIGSNRIWVTGDEHDQARRLERLARTA